MFCTKTGIYVEMTLYICVAAIHAVQVDAFNKCTSLLVFSNFITFPSNPPLLTLCFHRTVFGVILTVLTSLWLGLTFHSVI